MRIDDPRRFLYPIAVGVVLLTALVFRVHGHNWDGGWYQHPDERHVVMVLTERIGVPSLGNLTSLFDPGQSPLNTRSNGEDGEPRSFAYGSLPLLTTDFLAWLVGSLLGQDLNSYGEVGLFGRYLTALLDVGTILIAMLIARRVYGRSVAIVAGALLASTVLLIQLAHFFTVDSWVTFFSTAALYCAIRLADQARLPWALLAGGLLGAALATKVSVVTLAIPVLAATALAYRPGHRQDLRTSAFAAGRTLLVIAGVSLIVFAIFEPYAFWQPGPFLDDAIEQWRIVNGRFDVPFTRQFVGKIPVRYELGNLVHWGLGPALGIASLFSLLVVLRRMRRLVPGEIVLLAWIVPYFALIATAEAKFMRYGAPIVPSLVILGAGALSGWVRTTRTRSLAGMAARLSLLAVVVSTLLWAVAFSAIYRQPNARVAASEWIYENIPEGSKITAEYWDDALPIPMPGYPLPDTRYDQITMDLYADRPNDQTLAYISTILNEADFIILSSDRLAGSIPNLPWRYPVTSEYYRLLESGQLGYQLVYESDQLPQLGPLTVDDRGADESFTVYDHPHVRIFRKVQALSLEELRLRFAWSLEQPRSATRAPLDESLLLPKPVDAMPAAEDLGWSGTLTNNGVAAALVWLVVIELFALAFLPIGLRLFQRFADGGLGLARLLSVVMGGFVVWISVSLELIRFELPWLLVPVVVAGGAAWYGLRRTIWHPRERWKELGRLAIASELAFLLAFSFFLALRSLNPDLWQTYFGGEKPMESAYISGIARSASFPPFDPWFAHGVMNYYYYGFYLMTLLWKLTGVPPELAFQLSIATVGALTVAAIFSLGSTLGRDLLGLRRVASIATLGALAVLLHTMIGNLDGARQVLDGRLSAFDFWQSSRVVDFAITEFPYFTLIWADLHPHAIALPLTVLALGLGYAWLRQDGRWDIAWQMLWAMTTAVSLGTLIATNSWDGPFGVAIIGAALLTRALATESSRLRSLTWAGLVGALVVVGGFALFWPFFSRFVALVNGVAVSDAGTKPGQFLIHFGLFLGIIGAAAIVAIGRCSVVLSRHATVLAIGPIAALTGHIISSLIEPPEEFRAFAMVTLLVAGIGAAIMVAVVSLTDEDRRRRVAVMAGCVVSLAAGALGGARPTAALLLLPLTLGILIWSRHLSRPAQALGGFALAGGAAITLGADIIYVVDDLQYSEWQRMNSVFKFYLESWTLLVLAAFLALVWLLGQLRARPIPRPLGFVAGPFSRGDEPSRDQASTWPAVPTVGVALLFSSLLMLGGLAYPLFGTPSRLSERMPTSPTVPTLDGLAWMDGAWIQNTQGETVDFSGDREAIEWLRANADGNAVLLEASIGPYRGNGSRISAGTGLPTVLGWDRHQRQQRYIPEIDQRLDDVRLIYSSTDIGEKRELLHRYRVRYIIVGEIERRWRIPAGFAGARQDGDVYAPTSGLTALDAMVGSDLRVAFQAGKTTIYEVLPFEQLPPAERAADIG